MVNIAPNPSFESDPYVDWYTHTQAPTPSNVVFSWATDWAKTGSRSVKIVATNVTNIYMSRWMNKKLISAKAGNSYSANIYSKMNLPGGAYANLSITFWSGVPAGNTFIKAYSSANVYGIKDLASFAVAATAPSGTKYIRIEARLYGSGTIWWDDVKLEETVVCGMPSIVLDVP